MKNSKHSKGPAALVLEFAGADSEEDSDKYSDDSELDMLGEAAIKAIEKKDGEMLAGIIKDMIYMCIMDMEEDED